MTQCGLVCWLLSTQTRPRAVDMFAVFSENTPQQHDVTRPVDEKCNCMYEDWANHLKACLCVFFFQGSQSCVGCYQTGGALRLREHGETPTLTGLWETALCVLRHWDLWLPLETLPALPRGKLQGKRIPLIIKYEYQNDIEWYANETYQWHCC